MDNRELEQKIRTSFENIAPDIWDSILTDCENQKGQVIKMQKKRKKKSAVKYIVAAAAALVLVVGALTAVNLSKNKVTSKVMLDVNPAIEISLNKDEKVLELKALNEDAKKVVGDMDFTGSNLDVTVNALIGSMLRNGYINEAANSVLVTVSSTDAANGQAMQQKLMDEINAILEGNNISAAVLGQTVSEDKEIQKLADQYGITLGKAKLIKQIVDQNSFYSFDKLVPLTINELNLISESGSTKLNNVTSIGTASDSAYIGEQAATEIALNHAGVKIEDATRIKCELDWEDGIMVYEVDFDSNGVEYEYEINATTGEIVKSKNEIDDDYVPSSNEVVTDSSSDGDKTEVASSKEYISEETAKNTALQHAGVNEADIYDYSCELDHEHGITVYDIEFDANGYEYEYHINAETGEVVKNSRKEDDDYKKKESEKSYTEKQDSSSKQSDGIDSSDAKRIALKHAGLSEDEIHDYECEKDKENGRVVYEISFDCDGYEYEYDIDAETGEILKSEKERD